MKKIILNMFLTAFLVAGFTAQSWAFGWLGHHHHGQDSSGQGGSSLAGNAWNGQDPNGQYSQGGNPGDGGNNGSNPDPGIGNNGNNGLPVAAVPEPMTLYLLGIGFAGILLQRKLRCH